jgi:hypothetical protein
MSTSLHVGRLHPSKGQHAGLPFSKKGQVILETGDSRDGSRSQSWGIDRFWDAR